MSKKNKAVRKPAFTAAVPAGPPALLWVVLALALAIKLLYLKTSLKSPFYEPMLLDPAYYHEWAQRLVRGQWDREVFYGLPLYPYFLALCYKISGSSVLFVKLVQIALGTGTVFLVYKTGEKWHSRAVGVLAAFFAAVYGPLFFHEGIFIPEALGIPLYALSFYLVLRFLDEASVRNAVFLGLAAGLATLTKAGILLFMALFLLAMLCRAFRGKERFLPVILCAVVYAGVLAPVPLHNWFRGHDAVFLTSHAGFNFYVGNNPKSEGVFVAPEGTGSNVDTQIQDSRLIAEQEMGRPLKPSEVSRYWSEKARRFIRDNPEQFLRLCSRKLLLFFDAREISDVDDYQFAAKSNDFLTAWLTFAALAPLVFMGFVSVFFRGKYGPALAAWIGAYLLGIATFFVNARYRLPLLPVFFCLAAAGLFDFYRSLRELNFGKAALYGLALGAGIWVSQLALVAPNWTRDYVNAGDALLAKNDTAGAREYYSQALAQDPYSAKANLAMGLALTKEGRDDEAKGYYLKCIDADPKNSQAYNNLGLWYDRAGDLEAAERYFLKAIEMNPNSSQAHNNLGMMYGKRGDNEKAFHEFKKSLELNPKSARAHTNLGLILYRVGQVEQARKLWERALELDPGFPEARKALEGLARREV